MLMLALSILGCDQTEKQIEEEIIEEDNNQIVLTLQLNSETMIAGQEVQYEVLLYNQDSEALEASSWQIHSSAEENIFWNSEKFQLTTAGIHEMSLVATYNNVDYVSTAEITVTPANVFTVNLDVDSYTADAGENIAFATSAADRYGNAIEDVEIDVSTSSNELSVNGDQFYSLVADLYTATASYNDVVDEEHILITPAEAFDISLSVPAGDIEKNDSVHCDITIEDQYGNPTDDDWTLWADGTGNTAVSYDSITFLEEGEFTIYAQVDGTDLMDSYGPITIDSSGPVIDIYTPDRGEWTTASSTSVTGNVTEEHTSLLSLTVNEASVTPSTNGDFSTTLSNDFGLNLIETEAVDTDGNISTDIRGVLSGDYWSEGVGLNDSINVYIGSAGIQTLEDYALSTLAGINLADYLPSNPVTQQSVIGCTASINLYNPSYSSTDLDINPNSDGTITITFTLYDMYVYADVPLTGGSWWNPCPDFSGDIDADSIVVTVIAQPSVSSNQLSVDVTSSSATINGLDVDLDGWTSILNFVVNFFEDDLSQMLEDELIQVVEDQIPTLLEDVLQNLAFNETFNILGNTYTLNVDPSSVDVDNYGINLGMRSNITASSWVMPDTGLGSLYADYSTPYFSSISSVNISLSLDVINQLLYQVWGGGAISQELTFSSLGISSSDLELLFPDASDLRVTVEPLLPPVAVPDGSDLELQVGDLYIALHNGSYASGDIRMELYANIFAPLEILASSSAISANVGDPESYFDVVYPTSGSDAAESLLDELIPLLLPTLTDAIGEIELPTFQGFTVSGINTTLTGGQLKLTGTLSN